MQSVHEKLMTEMTCHHIGNLRLFLCVTEVAMAP